MRLLAKKLRKGGQHGSKDLFSINKGSFTFRSGILKKLQLAEGSRASVGLNDMNMLCLFFTHETHPLLFKLTKSNPKTGNMYISFNKSFSDGMVPYVGDYRIGQIIKVKNIYQATLLNTVAPQQEMVLE